MCIRQRWAGRQGMRERSTDELQAALRTSYCSIRLTTCTCPKTLLPPIGSSAGIVGRLAGLGAGVFVSGKAALAGHGMSEESYELHSGDPEGAWAMGAWTHMG